MPLFGSPSSASKRPAVANGHVKSEASLKEHRRSGSVLSRFREMSSAETSILAEDPSIKAASQKLAEAEIAERAADKALELARQAVREARQHVKSLETSVLEEARRARAKQRETKTIRKGVNRLGRHDHTD